MKSHLSSVKSYDIVSWWVMKISRGRIVTVPDNNSTTLLNQQADLLTVVDMLALECLTRKLLWADQGRK